MTPILAQLAERSLTEQEAFAAVTRIVHGQANDAEIAALLMGLRVRGETAQELAGTVRALRTVMRAVTAPANAIDLCGTGGAGRHTLNVSTAAAFVASASGLVVAKHGNRAVSSRSGAADVLAALGIDPDPDLALQERHLLERGLAFLHAPRHHPALAHATAARRAIGVRSIFNLAGPLCNPAGARRQLIGVYDRRWLRPMAETLATLGAERAWIVHGDGLDEITLAGETDIIALEDGVISSFKLKPEDAGLSRAPLSTIAGGDPAFNARAMLAMLSGEQGPYRDIVLLNTAASLMIAQKFRTLNEAVQQAGQAIDSGAALAKLEEARGCA